MLTELLRIAMNWAALSNSAQLGQLPRMAQDDLGDTEVAPPLTNALIRAARGLPLEDRGQNPFKGLRSEGHLAHCVG